MSKIKSTPYTITHSESGEPPTCFPTDLDQTDLAPITTIGDDWAKFINVRTGVVHDCAEYYRQMMLAMNPIT